MSEFDDPGFRDQLQRLGGHYTDDEVAYATLLQKVRVAKRRRAAAVFGSLGAACLFAIGAFVVTGNDSHRLRPADSSVEEDQVISETTDVEPPESSTAVTESTEPASTETIATTASTTAPTEATAPISLTPNVSPPSNTSSSDHGSGSKGKGTTSSSSSSSPAPAATPSSSSTVSVAEVRTFVSDGGSITVRLQDGSLTLLDTTANAGYRLELDKNEPSQIRVKFVNDTHESRIDVTISDGHLRDDVSEETRGSTDSGSTVPGDH